jgi:hypothetical protein
MNPMNIFFYTFYVISCLTGPLLAQTKPAVERTAQWETTLPDGWTFRSLVRSMGEDEPFVIADRKKSRDSSSRVEFDSYWEHRFQLVEPGGNAREVDRVIESRQRDGSGQIQLHSALLLNEKTLVVVFNRALHNRVELLVYRVSNEKVERAVDESHSRPIFIPESMGWGWAVVQVQGHSSQGKSAFIYVDVKGKNTVMRYDVRFALHEGQWNPSVYDYHPLSVRRPDDTWVDVVHPKMRTND